MRIATILSALATTASANFLVDNTLHRNGQVHNVLAHQPAKSVPQCQNLTGPIETTLCDYETVESVNKQLYGNLSELVRTPFFKYFQVDLYRECPFWPDHGSCSDPGCAITTIDESDVPEKWRAKTLSQLDAASIEKRHELPGCYYRDSDFCFLDDHTEGDYYDLSLIPERYTGYSGRDAQRIWRAIYEENCFGLSELNLMSSNSPAPVSLPDSMTNVLRANGEPESQCLEKRVYYKVISGLHASISTHICREWLNQSTGEWAPNLQCFISRVAAYPERLQYIYFDAVLLQRAVARLGPYLMAYDYCSTGNHEDDEETRDILSNVISIAQHVGKFDETVLFRGENANVLKEEFKTHFRNVTRIMDCIGCDKCRLWGKIQTMGLATAMKILFELDEKALDPRTNSNLLQRAEVVALLNTLHRITESLEAYSDFRQMWAELNTSDSEALKAEAEKPRHASPADQNQSTLTTASGTLQSLKERCKDGLAECAELLQHGINALGSILKPSNKERGPGFGEL
ncbi:hypothetical protein AX16_005233 [Volvariella volvacea WC 439]|nr:hypothetical protein AX16_005233 [Volvariella volvacea WC 439]